MTTKELSVSEASDRNEETVDEGDKKKDRMSKSSETATTTLTALLDQPTEMSVSEYTEMLHQIETELTIDDCKLELLDAARYNDIDVLRGILKCHVSLRHADAVREAGDGKGNNTPLHMAAANGHTDVVRLLLAAHESYQEQEKQQTLNDDDTDNNKNAYMFVNPVSLKNESGNTPLHWAATNGKSSITELLLNHRTTTLMSSHNDNGDNNNATDVLQRNKFGRSALTEGFAAGDTDTVKSLLEHESAAEERLVLGYNQNDEANSESQGKSESKTNDDDDKTGGDKNAEKSAASVTHDFIMGRKLRQPTNENNGIADVSDGCNSGDNNNNNLAKGIPVKIRELAMANTEKDRVLPAEQEDYQADATGLSLWAASIVAAAWMADLATAGAVAAELVTTEGEDNTKNSNINNSRSRELHPFAGKSVLELGAGCGLPGLTVANAGALSSATTTGVTAAPAKVYLTDLNPDTVSNLQHNVTININNADRSLDHPAVKVLTMNWKDPSTWPVADTSEKDDDSNEKKQESRHEQVDVLLGSDLIYQESMAALLVDTVSALLKEDTGRFYYVAPAAAEGEVRKGHTAFLKRMEEHDSFHLICERLAPAHYAANPLANQDDDLCFLHFHELMTAQFTLYTFQKQKQRRPGQQQH